MRKTVVRIIALVLVSSAVAAASASCARQEDGEGETSVSESTAIETEAVPAFSDKVFQDGEKFTVLTINPNDPNFGDSFICADSHTGSVIDEAVIQRNLELYKKYNVTVETKIGVPSYYAQKAVKTGTVDFDLVYDWGIRLAPLALDGYFADFHEIPNIDLTQSYWSPSTQDDLSLAGKLFISTSDITMNRIGYADFVIFNKSVLDELKLTYPYEYVANNNWTFDRFLSMALETGKDIDSDSLWTSKDRYGTSVSKMEYLVRSSGIKKDALIKNGDGTYSLNLYTEELKNLYCRFSDYTKKSSDGMFCDVSRYKWEEGKDITQYLNKYELNRVVPFGEGHIVLDTTSLEYLPEFARIDDLRYGMVPNPKSDPEQKEYYHYVDTCAPMFSVIKDADLEKVGTVMEYLSYQSEKILRPVYIDSVMKQGGLTDPRDVYSCNIIVNSTHYSPTSLYYLGIYKPDGSSWDAVEVVLDNMIAAGNFSSVWKKYGETAQKSIDDFITKIQSAGG